MSAQEQNLGGWTAFGPVTPEAQQVFDQALASILGVKYVAKEVSTQVVAGINYRFKTQATVVGSSSSYPATVSIYAAPGKDPVVTEIHKDA